MKTNYFILLLLVSSFFIGCINNQSPTKSMAASEYASMEMDDDIEIEPPRTAEIPPPPSTIEKGTKIIKSGSISLEVGNLDSTKSALDSLLKKLGGYYERELYNNATYRIEYDLKIRIPNNQFETLIQYVESGKGKLLSKEIDAQDVSEEYTDLTIRLENKLAYLKQYQTILQKAKSIKEILEVKEKIRAIEEEIESKKGRIRFLDDQVKYATLRLGVSQFVNTKQSYTPSFWTKIGNAFNQGIDGIFEFTLLLISIWPFVLVGVALFLSRKKIWGAFRK